MDTTYPKIEPGLVVRYRNTAYETLRGAIRVVSQVDQDEVRGHPADEPKHPRTLVGDLSRFWEVFEPVESDVAADDGGSERPAGVWVAWRYNDGPEVDSIYSGDDELGALRHAVEDGLKVTHVEYGQDFREAVR